MRPYTRRSSRCPVNIPQTNHSTHLKVLYFFTRNRKNQTLVIWKTGTLYKHGVLHSILFSFRTPLKPSSIIRIISIPIFNGNGAFVHCSAVSVPSSSPSPSVLPSTSTQSGFVLGDDLVALREHNLPDGLLAEVVVPIRRVQTLVQPRQVGHQRLHAAGQLSRL